MVEDRLPRHPYPLVVKCVAVIREFYRKSVKSRVGVEGRRTVSEEVVETVTDGNKEGGSANRAGIDNTVTVYFYVVIFVFLCFYEQRF